MGSTSLSTSCYSQSLDARSRQCALRYPAYSNLWRHNVYSSCSARLARLAEKQGEVA